MLLPIMLRVITGSLPVSHFLYVLPMQQSLLRSSTSLPLSEEHA